MPGEQRQQRPGHGEDSQNAAKCAQADAPAQRFPPGKAPVQRENDHEDGKYPRENLEQRDAVVMQQAVDRNRRADIEQQHLDGEPDAGRGCHDFLRLGRP